MLPSSVPAVVGSIRLAPVAASIPVAELSGIAVAGNPAAIALAKNAKRPQFTGRNQDWVFFKRDWCKYVRQLGGKIAIGEENLMQLLELALDEASQHNCQRRIQKGELTSYTQLWEELEEEYRRIQGVTGKQAWQDMQLTYEGPLTWIAYKGFWENFLTLKDNVEDATDDEAYHILIKQIPDFFAQTGGGASVSNFG